MTTYHDAVRTAVAGLVDGRYYPTKFPQESTAPTWPAMRGTMVSGDNAIDQCGAGELDEEDLRLQLDVCATSYDQAAALFASACTALAVTTPAWIRQPGRFEGWDAEARVHRFTADFMLYQSSG
jgi:hypothetical protein